ncbi:hypothetical protein ABH935_005744 [Catenulispora sp. GAS73]
MRSMGLVPFQQIAVRPLVVAITHLPILIVTLSATPLWVMAVVTPKTHGDLAMRFLQELRDWSHDLLGAIDATASR